MRLPRSVEDLRGLRAARRGLWTVHARFADGGGMLTQPEEYDVAAIIAPQLGETGRIVSATLLRLPNTRAAWETRAPWEASDPPVWGAD